MDGSYGIGSAGVEFERFDIFLSYNQADDLDTHKPSELRVRLQEAGYSVWFDKGLQVGRNWQTAIQDGLKRSRMVVALWSKRSVHSDWCKVEAINAAAEDKLLPVLLEELHQDDFPDAVLQATSHIQRISFDHPDLLAQIGEHVRPSRPPSLVQRTGEMLSNLPEVLRSGQLNLFGREQEESLLLDAWASCAPDRTSGAKTNLVVLHAIGGQGKTAILRRFVDTLHEKQFPHADAVIGWSAYSQGTGDNRNASADTFIEAAVRQIGYTGEMPGDAFDRARLLATLAQKKRTLLLLDGIEPLQYERLVLDGRLKDKGLALVITQLARNNPGLVVVTSRQPLPEVENFPNGVADVALEQLNRSAGAGLLKRLGCWGKREDLENASDEADGHALTITALGGYIASVEGGDIRKRDHFKLAEIALTAEELAAPDPTVRAAKKAARIMEGYISRFEAMEQANGGGSSPERLLLNIVGLFDRPAEGDAVHALLNGPLIAGLTDTIGGWSGAKREARLRAARTRLEVLGLLLPADAEDSSALDAHPIIRAHFGKTLKESNPDAHRQAHEMLYRMYATRGMPAHFQTSIGLGVTFLATRLDPDKFKMFMTALLDGSFPDEARDRLPKGLRRASPEEISDFFQNANVDMLADAGNAFQPIGLESMTPLFHAIAHGCAAGLHLEAFDEVYLARIRRPESSSYIASRLGAYGADLGALAHFFAVPWTTPVDALTTNARSAVLNYAAFALKALGRLVEAEQAEAAGLAIDVAAKDWSNAAIAASNLVELRFALGDIAGALTASRDSVTYADNSEVPFHKTSKRTNVAYAVLHAGRADEAIARFVAAEEMHATANPQFPQLYSLGGYQYCDTLLELGRATEVLARAEANVQLSTRHGTPLDIGLSLLARARAAAHLSAAGYPQARAPLLQLNDATNALRRAGQDIYVAESLLAFAEHLRRSGQFNEAGICLDEVYDLVTRGGIRLHLMNWRLESARLCLAQIANAPPETIVPLQAEFEETAPAAPPPKQPSILQRLFRTKAARQPSPPSTAVRKEWRVISPPQPSWAGRDDMLSKDERQLLDAAEQHFSEAYKLIQATGYHRRDNELRDLRKRLDRLAALR